MADFTITIRVSGTAGGQSISWARTATITDIDVVVQNGHNAVQIGEGSGSIVGIESAVPGGVGLTSYTGIAVSAVVSEGQGTLTLVTPYDVSLNSNGSAICPPGVPFITYQGGDFNGAMNIGSSATLQPTVDIGSIAVGPSYGFGSFKALAGLKAVS